MIFFAPGVGFEVALTSSRSSMGLPPPRTTLRVCYPHSNSGKTAVQFSQTLSFRIPLP